MTKVRKRQKSIPGGSSSIDFSGVLWKYPDFWDRRGCYSYLNLYLKSLLYIQEMQRIVGRLAIKIILVLYHIKGLGCRWDFNFLCCKQNHRLRFRIFWSKYLRDELRLESSFCVWKWYCIQLCFPTSLLFQRWSNRVQGVTIIPLPGCRSSNLWEKGRVKNFMW